MMFIGGSLPPIPDKMVGERGGVMSEVRGRQHWLYTLVSRGNSPLGAHSP
jgi:hypothetical protein